MKQGKLHGPVLNWIIGCAVLLGVLAAFTVWGLPSMGVAQAAQGTPGDPPFYLPLILSGRSLGNYVILGWNDLGMHCYNRDFSHLALLPPYNNLWVQVIKRGDPPQIVTTGIQISYRFPDNTYSVNSKVKKTNFWDYAEKLFGVKLAPNIGLKNKGLSGQMDLSGDHYVAEGIPLTEFSDSDTKNRQPYQLAEIIAKDSAGNQLATQQVVAPVSTEMHCDNCHSDGAFGIRTGSVETNILTLHDNENASEYPPGHTGKLMDRQPILCAECHASNALNAQGLHDVPSLSNAMHEKHTEVISRIQPAIDGCYSCHPGPNTKCLRDVMSSKFKMDCTSCHGPMNKVAQNPNPWLNEPRCTECHKDAKYAMDKPLYRQSKGHGGLYCEACHDSTHAIAPSTQPLDGLKFISLQGSPGPLKDCTVCHLTQPTGPGPHQ